MTPPPTLRHPGSFAAKHTNGRPDQIGQAACCFRTLGASAQRRQCYTQVENLKLAIRVAQLKLPLAGRYSVVYQKVQSSVGSICIAL